MQSLHTHTAMRHADLPLRHVWDHFINMGGIIDEVEVDAYLHGLIFLPAPERDCVAQAVNELLDDLTMTGTISCCRAPYSYAPRPVGLEENAGRCRALGYGPGAWTPRSSIAEPMRRFEQPIPHPLHRGSYRKW